MIRLFKTHMFSQLKVKLENIFRTFKKSDVMNNLVLRLFFLQEKRLWNALMIVERVLTSC